MANTHDVAAISSGWFMSLVSIYYLNRDISLVFWPIYLSLLIVATISDSRDSRDTSNSEENRGSRYSRYVLRR